MIGARAIVATVIILIVGGHSARAQSAGPGRFEFAAGPRWTGGLSLAAGDASETTSSGSAFRLFTTSTTLASATSFDARFSVRIAPRLQAQVSGDYGTPTLRINAGNDVEGAASITATERIQQFVVRGGVSWSLPRPRRFGFAPFLTAEAGYLRELHDAQTHVQTGRVIEIGGGATYPFKSNGSKEVGARIDARAVLRSKGAALDDDVHVTPALSAGVYLRF